MASDDTTDETDSLAAARARVRSAYSPETLRSLGSRLAERLAEHLQQVQQGEPAVLNWREPAENFRRAHESLNGPHARQGEAHSLEQRFSELVDLALSRGHNLHHPGYIGHQVPASVPLAGLFDALGAITNQVMAIYEMGPWATAVEQALVQRWGEQIGLPAGEFAGLITHGGSLANLTALLTARNVALRDAWSQGLSHLSAPPVILCHADSHYSVARAAGILGIGSSQIHRVPLDSRRRMDPQALDELITRLRSEGTPIVAVSACACATPIGAFDPLEEIAAVCRRHQVWLHVDAAHGGAVAFSRRHRSLIRGLELADSFVCDAHKTLFVPALCAFVFYRQRQHRFETFQQDAPYLFDPSAPGLAEVDSGIVTVECTKRAAAYGLWGIWSLLGPELFGDLIDITFATARSLYEKLLAAEDFEPLHEPECNIVVFRYRPPGMESASLQEVGELNRAIRRRLIESGDFYIVQTNIEGTGALRVSVMNPLTTESHLDALLNAIRKTAAELGRN